jgi:hypothetical protein
MPRRVAPQGMKIEDEDEKEDEGDFLVRPHAPPRGPTNDENGSRTRTRTRTVFGRAIGNRQSAIGNRQSFSGQNYRARLTHL